MVFRCCCDVFHPGGDARVRTSRLLLQPRARIRGERAHRHFINDHIFLFNLRRFHARPIERLGFEIVPAQHVGIVDVAVRRVFRPFPENLPSRLHERRVRIHHHPILVPSRARLPPPRALASIPVPRPSSRRPALDARVPHVPRPRHRHLPPRRRLAPIIALIVHECDV